MERDIQTGLPRKEVPDQNQLINLAVSEKLSALLTVGYLKERAEKGSHEEFEKIMAEVPDVEPEEYDEL